MQINTVTQDTIPAIELNKVQFSRFNMSSSSVAPYKVGCSATIRMYWEINWVRYYADEDKNINIPDVSAFILAMTDPDKKTRADEAVLNILQWLGVVAEMSLWIDFINIT